MKKTSRILLLLLLAACVTWLITTRCSPPDNGQTPTPPSVREVEIVATDYAFTPDHINAGPGESLTIILRNEGTVDHRIRFVFPNQVLEITEGVAPGGSAQLAFTTPQEAGDYVYYDQTDDYRALGMEGILTVSASP